MKGRGYDGKQVRQLRNFRIFIMKQIKSIRKARRERIKRRMRDKIRGTSERPRITIYKSLRAIYANLVDDVTGHTILGVSSLSKQIRSEVQKAKGKVEVARIVGKTLGKEAKKRSIEQVVFDRSGYLYHGRVKAFAEGAREAGLKF